MEFVTSSRPVALMILPTLLTSPVCGRFRWFDINGILCIRFPIQITRMSSILLSVDTEWPIMCNYVFTRTPWHGNVFHIFTLPPSYEGNPAVWGGFPTQRTSNVELWYFRFVSVNKLLSKGVVDDLRRHAAPLQYCTFSHKTCCVMFSIQCTPDISIDNNYPIAWPM